MNPSENVKPYEVPADVEYSVERRSVRVPANIPVRLMRAEGKIERPARAVDLSTLGARIQTNFEVSAGETVKLLPWGDYGKVVPSRVVWVQRESSEVFLAGLEFLSGSMNST